MQSKDISEKKAKEAIDQIIYSYSAPEDNSAECIKGSDRREFFMRKTLNLYLINLKNYIKGFDDPSQLGEMNLQSKRSYIVFLKKRYHLIGSCGNLQEYLGDFSIQLPDIDIYSNISGSLLNLAVKSYHGSKIENVDKSLVDQAIICADSGHIQDLIDIVNQR